MPTTDSNETDHTNDRLIQLESAVAHLQHDLEQMHESLLSQNAELVRTREQLARLERRMQLMLEPPEVRDPMAERPPHY